MLSVDGTASSVYNYCPMHFKCVYLHKPFPSFTIIFILEARCCRCEERGSMMICKRSSCIGARNTKAFVVPSRRGHYES